VSESMRTCRVCGCSDSDCRTCIEKTGRPCFWVEDDLCSACAVEQGVTSKESADGVYALYFV